MDNPDQNREADENPFYGLTLPKGDIPAESWFGGRDPARIMEAVASFIGCSFTTGGESPTRAGATWGAYKINVELTSSGSEGEGGTVSYWYTMQGYLMRPGDHFACTCELREERLLDTIAKKVFSIQDVEVGHSEFDKRYLIKGHPEDAVRELFSAAGIRVFDQPSFEVRLADIDDRVMQNAFRKTGSSDHALFRIANHKLPVLSNGNDVREQLFRHVLEVSVQVLCELTNDRAIAFSASRTIECEPQVVSFRYLRKQLARSFHRSDLIERKELQESDCRTFQRVPLRFLRCSATLFLTDSVAAPSERAAHS